MAEEATKKLRGRPRNNDKASLDVIQRIASRGVIRRSSDTPLWVQLKNALADEIGRHALKPEMRLPAEQTIAELLEVSRPVVRAALDALSDQGLVAKVPRRGIFVTQPRSETSFLTSNVSVHSDLQARGHLVEAQAFLFERCAPDEDEQRIFSLPPDGTVIRIGRIYRSDSQPITHTVISLPGHKVPRMEAVDIQGRSIFEILNTHYGLTAQRAERWFTAALAPEDVAGRLEVPPGHPLISIESVAYDAFDAPLEYYRAYYNSDVARIHVSTGAFSN
ncbi:GntR family transcriptional regulator [Mesobaculum littorinae]|uniref:GntR family transcriptional regulator n=1 Tax=Mesobaculum littorinae TaxID=2486419 RepID=A0A438AEI2_9RHOB|nr:GntR family transcriptional regulator [Mesobaculum littorinae]RVV97087.1 GntR family transcriptional regulator [Mesobaculum littorinae]